ncbi:MAG: FlgO family outer membrane protein [Desulfobia sp.]
MKYGIIFLLSTIVIVLLGQFSVIVHAFEEKTVPEYLPPLKSQENKLLQEPSDKLITDIKEIASVLCQNLEYPDPLTGDIAGGLLVATFVELDDLYFTSSFGRYLAEQLMTEFQQRRYNVVEIRKSRSILIRKQRGEFGISRDPSEIKREISADGLLSGTYTAGPEHVLVNARILDNRTGKLLAAATKRISRTAFIDSMLNRSFSSEIEAEGVMYMKELGKPGDDE